MILLIYTFFELLSYTPKEYINLDNGGRIEGLDSMYLISMFDSHFPLLRGNNISEQELYNFYRINWGLSNSLTFIEDNLTKHHKIIEINPNNLGEVFKIINDENPIDRAELSKIGVERIILRSFKQRLDYKDFEIVIAKEKDSVDDLLYFWNRVHYEGDKIFYFTLDDLKLLSGNEYLGHYLGRNAYSDFINIVSKSLNENEINDIIRDYLIPLIRWKPCEYKNISEFPFEIADRNGYKQTFQESQHVNVIGEQGIITIPKLSFTNSIGFYPQRWACDLVIKPLDINDFSKTLFPCTLDTISIIPNLPGRINKKREVTVYPDNDARIIKLVMPSFNIILRQIIQSPIIDENRIETEFIDISYNDSSNKLLSFVNLFDTNFREIKNYFSDKVWSDIFDELCISNKIEGDCISFENIVERLKDIFEKEHGIILTDGRETRENISNLKQPIWNYIIALALFI